MNQNPKDLTIKEIAKELNINPGTVFNWIKTGHLNQLENGLISNSEFIIFKNEVLGKKKLVSRANKSLKDDHDHQKITENLKNILEKFSGEEIGYQYENMLSNSYRNKEGIYYTPTWIIKDMFKDIEFNKDYKFLDPCCGSGNFIIEAIKNGIHPKNVYGFDIDKNAVEITKKRIKDQFGYESNNIKVCDFLQESQLLNSLNIKFDLIFTNPPWGKKINRNLRKKYSNLYDCGNSLDTTSLFLGASLTVLKEDGYLGFLVQDAFFNISAFKDIRKKTLEKKILKFVDYCNSFKNVYTEAKSIILKNTKSSSLDNINCVYKNNNFNRTIDTFKRNPKTIFNFWATEQDIQIIDRLYSIKHITLKNNAKWGMGIVTGNNKKFCINQPKEGYIPIYKGSDIIKEGIKPPSVFILNDFTRFQQICSLEMFNSEKLIYKFISSKLCFFHDTENRLVLNSANFVIPQFKEISLKQVSQLLNSDIINWLFKKLFLTHKILKGDIELLPIHYKYFLNNKDFNESDYLNYLGIIKKNNGYQILNF